MAWANHRSMGRVGHGPGVRPCVHPAPPRSCISSSEGRGPYGDEGTTQAQPWLNKKNEAAVTAGFRG